MSEIPSNRKVSLTAYWGNDDVSSTIELTQDELRSIQKGGDYVGYSESWYEGESEDVTWSFVDCTVSIDGEDGRQCLIDVPISELIIEE